MGACKISKKANVVVLLTKGQSYIDGGKIKLLQKLLICKLSSKVIQSTLQGTIWLVKNYNNGTSSVEFVSQFFAIHTILGQMSSTQIMHGTGIW